jgi:hypothetical protein
MSINPHDEKTIGVVKYERWTDYGNKIWRPAENSNHPYVCECGNDAFKITYPAPYQTDATCTKCGHSETVHSG